ncbi:hypothetical protein RvY_17095 [Ramazzottius varieornatus]|uniref:Pre-rRNA-processing protein Ipi1 N-terminal domain-containing protein n=1 Tax=Ramazzottius varieornatus TaxID=947166 RepID=A0A1D1W4Y5_RAMVA|nr:hypothetical protein RvY_17095 [Ramazzottius varieornatus]
MAKRTRRKQNERKDFQKVKFKVGKQKPKGLNATDTSFKTKGIALRTQFQVSSAAHTSSRGLGVKEICSLLGHSTASQRTFAFNELTDYLNNHATLACDNLGNLLNAILPRLMDEDHRLRTRCWAALTCLFQIATGRCSTALEPFSSVIVNYVVCGLTHVEAAIAVSSLSAVDLLTDFLPLKSCTEESVRLLKALMAMISVIGQSKKKKREVQLLSTGHFANGPARLLVLWRIAMVIEKVCHVEKGTKGQREWMEWDTTRPTSFLLRSPLAVDLTARPVMWMTEVESSSATEKAWASTSLSLESINQRPMDDLMATLLRAVFLIKAFFPSIAQEDTAMTFGRLAGHRCSQDILKAVIAYFHHLVLEQELAAVKFPATVFLAAIKVVTEENPVTIKTYKKKADKGSRFSKVPEMKQRLFPGDRGDKDEASNSLNRNAQQLFETYQDFILATNGNSQLRHKVQVEISKLKTALAKVPKCVESPKVKKSRYSVQSFDYDNAVIADRETILHDHAYSGNIPLINVDETEEPVEEFIESEIVFPSENEEEDFGMEVDNDIDDNEQSFDFGELDNEMKLFS